MSAFLVLSISSSFLAQPLLPGFHFAFPAVGSIHPVPVEVGCGAKTGCKQMVFVFKSLFLVGTIATDTAGLEQAA
jgi:hypothetical protein